LLEKNKQKKKNSQATISGLYSQRVADGFQKAYKRYPSSLFFKKPTNVTQSFFALAFVWISTGDCDCDCCDVVWNLIDPNTSEKSQ
jgi:hypothetical protein